MIKTGEAHLRTLRDDRRIYLSGRAIEDVTTHPAFRNAAATVGELYDFQGLPEQVERMTFETSSGRRANRAWQLPRSYAELDSLTDESKQLAKELKRRDFAFVGPTTVYATMQAVGLVNDHLAGCFVREEVDVAQRDVQRLFPSR